jgi:hypothetical protein
VGWIGVSTRTAQFKNLSVGLGHRYDQLKKLQRISPIGMEHRFGSPQLCSTVDASHHKLPRTKTSLHPRSKEILVPTLFFFASTKNRKRREKTTEEENILTERPPSKHHVDENMATSPVHSRAEVSDRDARCCLQEGYDACRANDTVP